MRGWCDKHYTRWKRHGDPLVALKDHTPAGERWRTSYRIDGECWIWTGPVDKRSGYGLISNGAGNQQVAHKFVWELHHGPVPAGKELDHKCRRPACIRPTHMEAVTHTVNVRRGDAGIANASKTHCKHGHEFTPENTYLQKGRWRQCRECMRRESREAQRRRRAAADTTTATARMHCSHGHELTPENTYIRGRERRCRACMRRMTREAMQRRRRARANDDPQRVE